MEHVYCIYKEWKTVAELIRLNPCDEECLGWSPERTLLEHEQAEQLLARDFAGPVAWPRSGGFKWVPRHNVHAHT